MPTPMSVMVDSFLARIQMLFWILCMVAFLLALVAADLGIVPGWPDFASGFLWLFGIAAFVMWAVIFKIQSFDNVFFDLLFMGFLLVFMYVWMVYNREIWAFAHASGLWDLLDISPSIAAAAPKTASLLPAQAEPITAAVESACQIFGPDLSPIADAPGRQAAEVMREMYESANPGGIYRIACVVE